MKGRITTEHTVWCVTSLSNGTTPFRAPSTVGHPHGCEHHLQMSEKPAAKHARKQGWMHTAIYGWICPACAAQYKIWKRYGTSV